MLLPSMLKLSLHHFQTLHSTLLSWLYDTMKHTFKHTVIKCYKGLFIPLHELPSGHNAKGSACQRRRCERCGFDPWVGKIPWSRKWQPTPVFLPGEFHGQRSLVDYHPWGPKESDDSVTQRLGARTHTVPYMLIPHKPGRKSDPLL